MRTGLQVHEAQQIVLEHCPVLGSETVAVRDALGRVLSEAVTSPRTLPPADVSAMDGYAVRVADCVSGETELRVVFEVAAGSQPTRGIRPGEAARIFTGAPVPDGADCVVRQEDAEANGDCVRIGIRPELHEHVRDAGEDVRAGDRVLDPGTVIRSPQVGMLASLGRSVVAVHRRPRVAILSGGDELVEPDGDVGGGRIVSSNSYTLAAQCLEVGAEPIYLGIARDDPADLERHLSAGLGADCIVSSAGVSVGDHDHVRPVLERLGCTLVFWGVLMKPGYPLAFGHFPARVGGATGGRGGPLVFGLPGNPVSAMVTFEQFVRPVLRRMAGHTALHRHSIRARCVEPLDKKAGRLHFVRVELEERADGYWARSTGNQSSGVLRSMTLAQGLLVFPAEATSIGAGEEVVVQIVDEGFFDARAPAR